MKIYFKYYDNNNKSLLYFTSVEVLAALDRYFELYPPKIDDVIAIGDHLYKITKCYFDLKKTTFNIWLTWCSSIENY
jgi:hypothetical protein